MICFFCVHTLISILYSYNKFMSQAILIEHKENTKTTDNFLPEDNWQLSLK